MFRKFSLVAAAAAALGAAALAPSSASAGWHGGWHHHHHHHGFGFGPRVVVGGPVFYPGGGCYVQRLVPTPWGPRWRLVNRCF